MPRKLFESNFKLKSLPQRDLKTAINLTFLFCLSRCFSLTVNGCIWTYYRSISRRIGYSTHKMRGCHALLFLRMLSVNAMSCVLVVVCEASWILYLSLCVGFNPDIRVLNYYNFIPYTYRRRHRHRHRSIYDSIYEMIITKVTGYRLWVWSCVDKSTRVRLCVRYLITTLNWGSLIKTKFVCAVAFCCRSPLELFRRAVFGVDAFNFCFSWLLFSCAQLYKYMCTSPKGATLHSKWHLCYAASFLTNAHTFVNKIGYASKASTHKWIMEWVTSISAAFSSTHTRVLLYYTAFAQFPLTCT